MGRILLALLEGKGKDKARRGKVEMCHRFMRARKRTLDKARAEAPAVRGIDGRTALLDPCQLDAIGRILPCDPDMAAFVR
jgi:hypothetical protein